MCGLCGTAGSIHSQDETIFKKAFIYNSTRGSDSTGAGSVKRNVKKDESMVLAKELGHPFELFDIIRKGEHDWSDIVSGVNKVLIGHTRSGTRGSINRKNAHPFLFDHVLGAHNGTLSYMSQNRLTNNKRYDTDSEAVIYNIESRGIRETAKDLEGAWALTWYDLRDNTINFLRNKERLLFYTFSEDRTKLYWSSEWEHLAGATNCIKRPNNSITLLTEDTLLSFVVPEVGRVFEEPTREKVEGYKPPLFEKKRWQGNSEVGLGGGTGTGFKPGDYSGVSWWDANYNMYKKWDSVEREHIYSHDKDGPYYDLNDERLYEGIYEDLKPKGGEASKNIIGAPDKEGKKEIVLAKTDPLGGNVIELPDIVRTEGLERRFKKDCRDVPVSGIVFQNAELKAYYNSKENVYTIYKWTGFEDDKGWKRSDLKICPLEIPLTKLDVNSRHQFSVKGKKKNRRVYYKGFRGNMLTEERFTNLMAAGCLCCNRQPEWSNPVVFINKTDFLCEHCSRDEQQVTSLRMMDK